MGELGYEDIDREALAARCSVCGNSGDVYFDFKTMTCSRCSGCEELMLDGRCRCTVDCGWYPDRCFDIKDTHCPKNIIASMKKDANEML